MHLDGLLNFPDRDVAAVWPRRTPFKIVDTLQKRGFRIVEVVDEAEAHHCLPLNFVALEPGKILLPAGGDKMRDVYERAGIECILVEVDELIKAGGGVHCMSGFLKRDPLV